MKINPKKILMVLLISVLGYVTYSENTEVPKKLPAIQRANATVDIVKINKIINVINYIQEIWVGNEEVEKTKLYDAAISGLVKSLKDPYSEYFTKKELDDFNSDLDGEYVGVGMEIRKEKGDYLEVISPFIGSPAYKAGIQIGDIITKIDDEDIKELTAVESSNKLKGKENTKVVIEVFRKNVKKPLTIELIRAKIKLDNVEYKMLEGNIGYISLLKFGSKTGDEIRKAVADLKSQGMEKLVFDLRSNPGGSLDEAVEISSIFIKEDLIVSLKDKQKNEKKYVRKGEQIFTGPMVVLINKGSASASEIVTGALKDYGRAKIIGTTSYGKGVVQSVFRFPEGDGLKLTIAEYFSPKNNKINKVGVSPDIEITMNTLLVDKGYINEPEEAKKNRKEQLIKLLKEVEGEKEAEKLLQEGDIQLKAAVDFLNGKEVKSNVEPKKETKTKKDLIIEGNENKEKSEENKENKEK